MQSVIHKTKNIIEKCYSINNIHIHKSSEIKNCVMSLVDDVISLSMSIIKENPSNPQENKRKIKMLVKNELLNCGDNLFTKCIIKNIYQVIDLSVDIMTELI